MERIRTLTSYAFLANGILHLGFVLFTPFIATSAITLAFGLAYLAFAYLVLRRGRTFLLTAAGVTALGLLLNIAGMVTAFHPIALAFLVFDLLSLAGVYQLAAGRHAARRAA